MEIHEKRIWQWKLISFSNFPRIHCFIVFTLRSWNKLLSTIINFKSLWNSPETNSKTILDRLPWIHQAKTECLNFEPQLSGNARIHSSVKWWWNMRTLWNTQNEEMHELIIYQLDIIYISYKWHFRYSVECF